eukprot:GFUD01024927.1.p1 GENE.GFUD01024927.1~~GFUD01024927.1.p1  ORF type:complete len:782 (-),score=177.44 GFUD01024927.1:193-2538(-)
MSMRQPAENIERVLKKLIEERDNEAIINFIDSYSSDRNEKFKSSVHQLTVWNDPETLQSILTWGEEKSLTPATGGDGCQDKDNPILVACQEDFRRCMGCLYQHGYRMKEVQDEAYYEEDKGCVSQRSYRMKEVKDETDYEEDDQVRQFLRFHAASNVCYLSLEFTEHKAFQNKEQSTTELTTEEIDILDQIDPLRKVFKKMKDADSNVEDFQGSSELKSNYIGIKKKLEAFTGGILTQCRSMHEVKTILDHNPEDDDDDELDDAYTNWQVALFEGHKDLVSHPNFQRYLWRKMTGDGSINKEIPFKFLADKIPNLSSTSKFRMKRALWNIKNIPLTILTFLFCYPFVVFADFLKKGDILFVNPKAQEERKLKKMWNNVEKQQTDNEDNPKGCFDYFRKRMHIPLFRMIPYFFIKVIYLNLICFSFLYPVDPFGANFQETDKLVLIVLLSVTFIISVSYLVDDIIQLFRPKHHKSFWNYFSLLTHLLLVGGAVIASISYHLFYRGKNLADLSGNSAVNVGMAMVSFGAGMEFFCVLQWLILLETTGPMVLCVLHAIKDALRMVSIYIVLFVAHFIAFRSLYKPFHLGSTNTTQNTTTYVLAKDANSFKTQRGLISTLFWRIIASAGPEMVNIKKTGDTTNDFSLEFSHLMGLILWGLYQIIIYVLMLNLLIAVMNTSYSELWQNRKRESKYSKSFFQAKFLEPLEIFPVPFRWIYYLARAVYNSKKEKNQDPIKQDKKKYFFLVRELILNKQEAEFEKSSDDKINDLKKDIFNELRKINKLK